MNKNVVINIICFGFGVGIGVLLVSAGVNQGKGTPLPMSADHQMDVAQMPAHNMIEIDTTLPVPAVAVQASKDAKDGYNLNIVTTNYRFTPDKVNLAPIQGEGHAHIYVNGVKVARLYGDWFNLPNSVLKAGDNIVEVTLNANDHSEWTSNGQHISAYTTVVK